MFEVKELLRAAKSESIDYVDGLVLLYSGQPLGDETTVGSHMLSRETTVMMSNQDVAKGRAARMERGERALQESLAAEAAENAAVAEGADAPALRSMEIAGTLAAVSSHPHPSARPA